MNLGNYKLIDFLTHDSLFQELLDKAEKTRLKEIGNKVYLRGLIEFSNYCSQDCYYCGIRKSNSKVKRYRLTRKELIDLAKIAYTNGYQSIALQSGEIRTDKEVTYLADTIKEIKDISPPDSLSLGITLSTGDLSFNQYKKLWEAGAHRYLLRIETSNRDLFEAIHPPQQSFNKRLDSLYALKELGFQVGTGVMVGLPNQTYEDLIMDLHFFKDFSVDMVGLGPYIPHRDTPIVDKVAKFHIVDSYITSLKMLALTRISLPNINMVASTALQTIKPHGLEAGIKAGANIIMPILTPATVRNEYTLYDNKLFTPLKDLLNRIRAINYQVGLWEWGDSPYFFTRIGDTHGEQVMLNE